MTSSMISSGYIKLSDRGTGLKFKARMCVTEIKLSVLDKLHLTCVTLP